MISFQHFLKYTLLLFTAVLLACGDCAAQSGTSNPEYKRLKAEAQFLYINKQYGLAVAKYDSALTLVPNSKAMYVNRALARIEVKNYSGAIEDCDKAIAIDFLLAEAYFVRGYVNHLVKENIKSLEDFDQAILLDPSHVDAFYNRAVVKKDLKDFVGACKDLEVAIQLGYSKAEYKKTEFCK